MKEELEMYPETYYKMSFGRTAQTEFHDGILWSAVQIERSKKNSIAVYRRDKSKTEWKVIDPDGNPCHPAMAMDGNRLIIVWNEVSNRKWSIRYAVIDTQTFTIYDVQTVYRSPVICLWPTVVASGGELHFAFAERDGQRISISIATGKDERFSIFKNVSGKRFDAFRPAIAASGSELYLAYDYYRKGRYEIAFGTFFRQAFKLQKTFGRPHERFLTPKLYANGADVYLLGVALQEVSDDRGIFDHQAWAFAARLSGGKISFLCDKANRENPLCAANLREGLLASKAYMGYHGLRRNPMLSFSENNEVRLFWEVMIENERNCQKGHLAMRRLGTGGKWEECFLVFSGGNAFSVPRQFANSEVPVAYLDHDKEEMELLQTSFTPLAQAKPYQIDPVRWERWHKSGPALIKKDRKKISVHGNEYRLYWADTHCHGIWSPDAEGEVDELINYARDFSGLDAACITDNDFYPFKSLTVPEWNAHERLAEHFTVPGKFTVFPGYEYTFHRRNIPQKFNHRIIFYPKTGGEIYRRIDPESNSDSKLLAILEKTDAIVYPHHVTYEITNRNTDRNVEIISSWRVYMAESDFTKKQLQSGQRFGFIGSGDCHRAAPGMGGAWTGIYATGLDAQSLAEAYRKRRLIATQGFPIFVDFRAGGGFIGEEIETNEHPQIKASIRAHKNIEYIKIFCDGEPLYRVAPRSRKCSFTHIDKSAGKGKHFYYLEIKLEGDPSFNMDPAKNSCARFDPFTGPYPHNLARARGVFAWTSPVWVKYI
ncbi:MAG: DUF3604 domain-containing protein [Verrucomicrobiota bacterium]